MRQAPRLLPGEQPGRDAGGAVHAAERREDVALERGADGVCVHVVPIAAAAAVVLVGNSGVQIWGSRSAARAAGSIAGLIHLVRVVRIGSRISISIGSFALPELEDDSRRCSLLPFFEA